MEKSRICLTLALMSCYEQEYIKMVFDTNWVVPLTPNVNGFEKELKECLDPTCSVMAVSSETAALYLALV